MSIQELKISGFRSLKDVTWLPGKLNLVVGPNGSGKSNLIRCLELISTVAKGKLEDHISDVGGVVPILWDHEPGSFGWRLKIDPVDEGRDRIEDALTCEIELAQVGRGSGYEVKKDTLGIWFEYEQRAQSSPFWIFKRDVKRAYLYDQQSQQLVSLEEESSENLDGYHENESLLSYITDSRNRIPTLVRHKLEGWNIHHDVHADLGSTMRKPATTQFTKKLASDGRNLTTVLHTLYTAGGDFKKQFNEGMRAGFGAEYKELVFQPAAAQQIQLAVQWGSSSHPHAGSDLSDGTLRFMFLLTVLLHPEPADLIAIDEPEAGLHPSMLPILAEYASQAAQRTQVVLTSHSPEFLDAFTGLSPQVTLCHWADGQSSLIMLDAEMLERWLKKYRLGEMFTRGELETLSLPAVEPVDDLENRLKDLPSEDEALATLQDHSEGDADA